LGADARDAVRRASARLPVAIVSGRDLLDVRALVGIPGLAYVGSHGLEIAGPGGWHEQRGIKAFGGLDRAERELRQAVARPRGYRFCP
jgi:trehalose 6-phosphate phosphatase